MVSERSVVVCMLTSVMRTPRAFGSQRRSADCCGREVWLAASSAAEVDERGALILCLEHASLPDDAEMIGATPEALVELRQLGWSKADISRAVAVFYRDQR